MAVPFPEADIMNRLCRCLFVYQGGNIDGRGIGSDQSVAGYSIAVASLKEIWPAAPDKPDNHVLVPIEPTDEQLGGIARHLMRWMTMDDPKTPRTLLAHFKAADMTLPPWIEQDRETRRLDHAFSKETLLYFFYKALIHPMSESVSTEKT